MSEITVITIRRAVSPLVSEQIQEIKKAQSVKLDPSDLDIKETDKPMVRKIKELTRESLERGEERLAAHAVDMIHVSINTENSIVTRARELRRQAKKLLEEARTIHNARSYLMAESNILPLALALKAVNDNDVSDVTAHVNSLNIPDYFAESKSKDDVLAD